MECIKCCTLHTENECSVECQTINGCFTYDDSAINQKIIAGNKTSILLLLSKDSHLAMGVNNHSSYGEHHSFELALLFSNQTDVLLT